MQDDDRPRIGGGYGLDEPVLITRKRKRGTVDAFPRDVVDKDDGDLRVAGRRHRAPQELRVGGLPADMQRCSGDRGPRRIVDLNWHALAAAQPGHALEGDGRTSGGMNPVGLKSAVTISLFPLTTRRWSR